MRVMLPPEGMGVVGVKDKVMVTDVLCAILSDAAIKNWTDVTEV